LAVEQTDHLHLNRLKYERTGRFVVSQTRSQSD